MTEDKRTYDTTSPTGNKARIIARVGDPMTFRYEVLVNGQCVGFGFADIDEAISRGVEYVRNGGIEGTEYA